MPIILEQKELSQSPLSQREFSFEIQQVPVTFQLKFFTQRVFLILTFNGKVGSFISCTPDETQVLLGNRDHIISETYARAIFDLILPTIKRPDLVIGLSLPQHWLTGDTPEARQVFREILRQIEIGLAESRD